MDSLEGSMAQLQAMFIKRMDKFQEDLQAVSPSTSVNNMSSEFTSFRTFIMSALQSLQEQVSLLAIQTDSMEMRTRRKILLFHGLPEEKDEDINVVVMKLIVSKLKMSDFSSLDISRCHRMGRPSTDKARPVVLKLRELDLRNKIWSKKSSLKGSGITLSEFLTKSRHEAFTLARQRFGVSNSWTQGGIIYVLAADGIRHRLTSIAELDKIAVPKPPKSTAATRNAAAPTSRVKKPNKK